MEKRNLVGKNTWRFWARWQTRRSIQKAESQAEQAAERLTALNRVGQALAQELDESRLLHLIAETACRLTEASFAAFTLRPIDEQGQPLVPSEGHLFRLAAVVGVSKEQERLLAHLALGGEGLLAPIFRQGVPVRVPDALTYLGEFHRQAAWQDKEHGTSRKEAARAAAFAYAHGHGTTDDLHSLGIPKGHPIIRSFLGVPLLDRSRQVRGGLLLGHEEPGRFTAEHETLLVGLAAQAAIALENARLYHSAQMHAQELDAIFESIEDGVLLTDNKGNILRENAAARRIREALAGGPEGEYALQQLLHHPAQQALHGEQAENIPVDVIDQHHETHSYKVAASPLLLPKSSAGPLFSTSMRQSEEASQSVSGIVIAWHDVTETQHLLSERQARRETEARRRLLQMVLDELPISVYLVRGTDARLVLANQAAATVWGAVWQQGQSMQAFLTANDIRILDTDGQPLPSNRLATIRAVQHSEIVRQHQEIIRHRDDTALPVLVNAVPLDIQKLRLPDGQDSISAQEPAALVVHQDVSALKEAEQLKDEFIGIAAHELRTPLAVLKGFAQTLLVQNAKGRGLGLVDWQLEALQGIDYATTRLVELTEDLLDVTRLQAGRLKLFIEPLDLIALARRVIARLQLLLEHHQLLLSSSAEYLVINVDRQRMEQVLHNLINNAVKYSPEGGPVKIELSQDQEKQMALLSIEDRGIGIPLAQQGQIFGRFVRADNASAHGIGGTGLGLYLCRELVERHGGRIWFESEEGKGSIFFVTLPLFTQDEMT